MAARASASACFTRRVLLGGERLLQRRQGGGVARAEDRLGRLQAPGRVRAHQGQAADRRLDRAADAVVDPHRLERGHGGIGRRRGTRRRVQQAAVGGLDVGAGRCAGWNSRLPRARASRIAGRLRAAAGGQPGDAGLDVVELGRGETWPAGRRPTAPRPRHARLEQADQRRRGNGACAGRSRWQGGRRRSGRTTASGLRFNGRVRRGSAAAGAAALAGLDVEVAARHRRAPIGDQVLRALEIVRPLVADDEARTSPRRC